MHVAVVIVGFRNAGDIVRCLAALAEQSYRDFEVVIVENGGPEAFARLREAVPAALPGGQPVTLIEAPGNIGFAGGNNLGIDHSAAADAWWILNPDTRPAPQALGALVERLERGGCEAVGGVLHFADGTVQSLGGVWQPWLARAMSIGHGSRLGDPVDVAEVERRMCYVVGASVLVGRRFFELAGRMRDEYFLYAEEIEWFLRGRRRGGRLGFAPQALVLHELGTSTGMGHGERERPKMPVYLDARNKMLLTRDVYPARLPLVAPASLLFTVYRFARKRAWRQVRYSIEGWFAGIRNRRGLPPWMAGPASP